MTSDAPISIQVADVDSLKDASSASRKPPSDTSSKHRRAGMDDSQSESGPGAPDGSLGQFSFAPATRTTVVTTTTTTTTSFPPLVIKPPRAANHLDPKLYPLASSPTPASLRNIKFDLGGQPVEFNEPEDAAGAAKEVSWSAVRRDPLWC
jgi:hypothetical protein